MMCSEVINFLNPQKGGIYVDATFGQGGYSRNILLKSDCKIIGIDRDKESEQFALSIKKAFNNRFFYKTGRFSNLDKILNFFQIKKINGIVFDLGVSNTQIDQAKRGFSFKKDGPLDMRMGSEIHSELTAEIIVNEFSEEDLNYIFFNLGEERNARIISNQIIKSRKLERIKTTSQLSKIINKVNPNKHLRIDGSTKVFQALRIFINKELEELKTGLEKSLLSLKKKSKIVVVSFHSLEDRIVKNFFRDNSGYFSENYKHLPQKNISNNKPQLKIITKKIIKASFAETKMNSRARSAKLRAAEKL